MSRKLLQIAIALACIVPITAGLGGVLQGVQMLGGYNMNLDSHFRYLSGLLLGLGLAFLTTIPNIENQGARVRLLAAIVVIGGIGRLIGFMQAGVPENSMIFALAMELCVTPLICFWQYRVAKKYK